MFLAVLNVLTALFRIQMKGVWIQVILITVCWSFAIISITMVDRILKYLYALFNCLQV